MLKRHNHENNGKVHRLSLELGGRNGATYEKSLAIHRDEGELLQVAMEALDALVGECRELLEMLSPEWSLPHLPGGVRLHRTLERGEYGVAVMLGRSVLAHATGSRKYEHNVARAALESALNRVEGWRDEVEAQYHRHEQEAAA